jgi:hypothetical protein
MISDYIVAGDATGASADLHRALTRELMPRQSRQGAASMLVTLTADAARAMEDAANFAAAGVSGDQDRSVIILLPAPATTDWAAVQRGATLWAFTRYAALSWAPRRVRINLISLGMDLVQPWSSPRPPAGPIPAQDVIAAIRAIGSWPCMTGQSLALGA